MHKRLQLRLRDCTAFGLLVLTLLLAACGGDNANGPSAKQLISDAQSAIRNVSSYHFNLNAENPGTAGELVIKTADGDMIVPDKLKATAKVLTFAGLVDVQMVSIKDKQYVTNPLTNTWTPTNGLLDPRTLSDSNTGVAAILGQIEDPGTPKDDTVDGTPCWSIDGKLDPQVLAPITGGGTPGGSKVATTTCIGKQDKLPYMIRLNGIAVQGDTEKTVRTFKLSKFGESVTIEAPI